MAIQTVLAPSPALVQNFIVKEGDTVKEGDVLVLLNIMKTEIQIKSKANGIVKKIMVKPEDEVDAGEVLVTIESK